MKTLHIVPGIDDAANGMAVVARLIAREQGDAEVVDVNHEISFAGDKNGVAHGVHGKELEEVWVHGMWLPMEWYACLRAAKTGKRLVRMTHGSLSPLYLKRQSPLKKLIVSPIEKMLLRVADRVVATCETEAEWIRAYEPRVKKIEVTDIKRFFYLNNGNGDDISNRAARADGELHLLYLGRRHPLKGLEYLEEAVRQMQDTACGVQLKIASNVCGGEKERIWDWCDALVLPTLSENFGLVVAEALERGKKAIVTDGAPAWDDGNDYGGRLAYLRGYRDGIAAKKVDLLKNAIRNLI